MARGEDVEERAAPAADLRFVAQLNMLHSMATALASLDDVSAVSYTHLTLPTTPYV